MQIHTTLFFTKRYGYINYYNLYGTTFETLQLTLGEEAKIEEIIGENNINNNFYLDLSDILWENIVLEIPIKGVKEGVHLESSSGKGWSVEEN